LEECPTNALIVADPYVSYAKIALLLNPAPSFDSQIDPTAVIAASASIADAVYIGAHCVIGENVIIDSGSVIGPGCVIEQACCIGRNSRLVANVTLCTGVSIGERCLIHPGVVIGSDGFGVANDHGRWIKVPQLGKVRIGNDVEIGANTTIDRGALDDTVIEDGVKLDNLIQVAHNVKIGAHTVIAGCVGIAGSAEIGKHCAIGGGVGVLGHLQIADGVQVTAMSMVTKSIKAPGVYSSGVPLQTNRDWHKNAVRFKQLDELAARVKELEQIISELTNKK
jgi:UDP-3-O-[3-hydroxymyristoyl] glucosamine N-acyltransferase